MVRPSETSKQEALHQYNGQAMCTDQKGRHCLTSCSPPSPSPIDVPSDAEPRQVAAEHRSYHRLHQLHHHRRLRGLLQLGGKF